MANDTFVTALEHVFSTYGDRVAVVDDGVDVTFAELEAAAAPYGRALLALGVTKGDHIAVLLPNCLEWLYLDLAASRLGAVIVPVNGRYRPSEIEKLFRSAQPRVLFAYDEFLSNNYLDRLTEVVPELAEAEPG